MKSKSSSSPVSPAAPATSNASPAQAAASSPPPQSEAEKKESLQERAARLRQKMEAVHQQKEAKKQEVRKNVMGHISREGFAENCFRKKWVKWSMGEIEIKYSSLFLLVECEETDNVLQVSVSR